MSLSRTGSDEDQYRKLQLEIDEEVRRKAFAISEDLHGHTVYHIPTKCGDVRCLLEFSVYVYNDPQHAEQQQLDQPVDTGSSHSSGLRHRGTVNGVQPSGSASSNPTPTPAATHGATQSAAGGAVILPIKEYVSCAD